MGRVGFNPFQSGPSTKSFLSIKSPSHRTNIRVRKETLLNERMHQRKFDQGAFDKWKMIFDMGKGGFQYNMSSLDFWHIDLLTHETQAN